MIFIDTLVRRLVPEWRTDESLSVACVSTTNPVYLVFNEHETHPALVIRIADSEEVCRAHKVIERLYESVGNLIPKPVVLAEYGKHRVAIQKGLAGLPWFQLATQYSTPTQWEELRGRALDALSNLHEGTKSFSDWIMPCEPGQELRQCFQQCVAEGTTSSPKVEQLVDKLSVQLDSLGSIYVHHQHGDFCLNNLMVEADQIHIIDFDDFGMTSMPLHDEFALALSMYSLAPDTVRTPLRHEISACVKDGLTQLGLNNSMLPGLFLHHLLLRLGKWSRPSRRQQYRKWLRSLTEIFAEEPALYFED